MINYYDILGVDYTASKSQIEEAFRKLKKDKNLTDEDMKFIIRAYKVLSNSELRYGYDKKLMKKKYFRKFKKIILCVGLTASVIFTGYSLKKQSEIEGYIEEIPDDFKVGSYVSEDDSLTKKDLKEEFVLIGVPDYTESIGEKSKFTRNIAKCLKEEKDFGFYINVDTATEEKMDAIIYRLNAITDENKWICNYPLYVEFNGASITTEKLFENISVFNKKLEKLKWFGVFIVNENQYQNYNGNENIKFHVKSENNQILIADDVVSYSYNKGLLGSVFGNSDINGIFDCKIYTKDLKSFIAYNGLNQNDLEEYYVGIDVSSFQGEIDWTKVKEEVDFVILRVCDFKNYHTENLLFSDVLDSCFKKNLDACEKYNIPYSFYYYPRAVDIEGIRIECQELNKYLKSCGLDFKNVNFFIDIENYNNEFVRKQLLNRNENLVNMVNMFCEEMKTYGYNPGIYISESDLKDFNMIKGGVDLTSNYPIWCASYGKNSKFYSKTNLNEYNEIYNYNLPNLDIDSGINLWGHQFTDKGYFPGIDENSVDVNRVLKKIYDN